MIARAICALRYAVSPRVRACPSLRIRQLPLYEGVQLFCCDTFFNCILKDNCCIAVILCEGHIHRVCSLRSKLGGCAFASSKCNFVFYGLGCRCWVGCWSYDLMATVYGLSCASTRCHTHPPQLRCCTLPTVVGKFVKEKSAVDRWSLFGLKPTADYIILINLINGRRYSARYAKPTPFWVVMRSLPNLRRKRRI